MSYICFKFVCDWEAFDCYVSIIGIKEITYMFDNLKTNCRNINIFNNVHVTFPNAIINLYNNDCASVESRTVDDRNF